MRRIVHGLDVGRRREKNEDYVLVDPALRLGIVADGVGGHRGGDHAARLVAESVHQTLKDQSWVIERIRSGDRGVDPEDLAKVTRYALNRASKIIHQEAQESLDLKGMSTTCTLFLDLGARGLVAHVGDSRAYLVRSGQVLRVTEDHVIAVASGKQASGKPIKQRVLSRAVGNAPEVAVDVMWVELRPTDSIILCSDGLSDQVASEEEFGEVLDAFGPEASPEVFIDLANVRGGPDNIALVVFGPEEGTNDLPAPRTPWAETKAQLQVLRNLHPFASLAYSELELLRPHVRVDVYPVGARVVIDPPSACVVASGQLELRSLGARFSVGSGALLGETALTTQKPWPYEVEVKEQAVLLVLPTSELLAFVADRPFASSRLLWTFLSTASERFVLLRDTGAEVGEERTIRTPEPPAPSPVVSATSSLPPPAAPEPAPEPAAPSEAGAAEAEPAAPSEAAPAEAAPAEAAPAEAEAAPAEAAPEPAPEPPARAPESASTPSLASAFSPPPPSKIALKLPPMPPLGVPLAPVPPPVESRVELPPDEEPTSPGGPEPAAARAEHTPSIPAAETARDEEASDPWGYDPRDLEAPVPSVSPVELLEAPTRSLFEETPPSTTIPPAALHPSPAEDEEERHTLPPPPSRRATEPPPEDKPS